MTREDVIRLAKEAGMSPPQEIMVNDFWMAEESDLLRFAALIERNAVEREREECARVAEAYEPRCDTCPSGVANAIRARGNDK